MHSIDLHFMWILPSTDPESCKKYEKMPKIDTLDALEEHEEHDDDYQTITN